MRKDKAETTGSQVVCQGSVSFGVDCGELVQGIRSLHKTTLYIVVCQSSDETSQETTLAREGDWWPLE